MFSSPSTSQFSIASTSTPTASSFKPFAAFRRIASRATLRSPLTATTTGASSARSTSSRSTSSSVTKARPPRPPSPRSLFVSSELAGWGFSEPLVPKPLVKIEKKGKEKKKSVKIDRKESDGKRRKELELAWEQELKGASERDLSLSPLTTISSIFSSTSTVSSFRPQTQFDGAFMTRTDSSRSRREEEADGERKRDTIIAPVASHAPLSFSVSSSEIAGTPTASFAVDDDVRPQLPRPLPDIPSSSAISRSAQSVRPVLSSPALCSRDDTARTENLKPKRAHMHRRASVSSTVLTSIFSSSLISPPQPTLTRANSLSARRVRKHPAGPAMDSILPLSPGGVSFGAYVEMNMRELSQSHSYSASSSYASDQNTKQSKDEREREGLGWRGE